VPSQSRGLALLAVTGLAITLTACSSGGSAGSSAASASTPAGPSSASAASASSNAAAGNAAAASSPAASSAAVPAGYKRVGGTAQGISLAVPSSWADIDLSQQDAATAIGKLKLSGVAATQLTQSLSQLQQSKAIVAADVKYAATSRGHFARNINAYCNQTDVTDTGRAAIPVLKAGVESQLTTIATHVTERETSIGGIPGLETSYQIKSGTLGALYGAQLEVLPKARQACFVTLTALSPVQDSGTLAVAAKTAQFR
jgi:hypothetical protein